MASKMLKIREALDEKKVEVAAELLRKLDDQDFEPTGGDYTPSSVVITGSTTATNNTVTLTPIPKPQKQR